MKDKVIIGGIYKNIYDGDLVEVVRIGNCEHNGVVIATDMVYVRVIEDLDETWGELHDRPVDYDICQIFLEDYQYLPAYNSPLWKAINQF